MSELIEELKEKWDIRNLTIYTGGVARHFDLECKLFKIHIPIPSFFKRYILGYKDYFYRIDILYKEPIKGNKYRFPLDVKLIRKNCIENNFSITFKDIKRNNEPNLSRSALNFRIQDELYNQLKINSRRSY